MNKRIKNGFTGECPICGEGGHFPTEEEFRRIAFTHLTIDHGIKASEAREMINSLMSEGVLKIDPSIGYLEKQTIELKPIDTDDFILDIGGGGEGIIGKLMGRQVIAIDVNPRELEGARHRETEKESLKIIMDASDLKFLPESFDVVTSFFAFMYIENILHQKVFNEVHKVLKGNGRFLIWDVNIPEKLEGAESINLPLEIILPDEEIETGYMVEWDPQDLTYFKELVKKTGFKVVAESIKGEIFYLELLKEPPVVPEVTVARLGKLITEKSLVVIDFWGPLCAPCVEMVPLIEELAREYAGKCVFRKLNVSNASDLVEKKYNISVVPALLFFKNGKLVDRIDDPYPDKPPSHYARACVSLIRATINRHL